MLDPEETRSMTCKQGTSMHVEARDGPEALKACTVRVSLQAADSDLSGPSQLCSESPDQLG